MTTLTDGGLRSISLREYERVTVQCSADVASRMHADQHVEVAPLPESGLYEIKAKHKVGVIRYDDLELRIEPKLPVARLLYLATYHADPKAWRNIDTLLADTTDPLSAIARALIFHAEKALRPAPLQGYVTHETAERRVRGRVLFDRQLNRRAGVLLPVELRYDEYELGITENRVLLAAMIVVARELDDKPLARRLRHLIASLDGVVPWTVGQDVPDFVFGRINERYRPALALARLVLERRSLEYPDQRVRGTAFLFNMNRLFEAFLETALARELETVAGKVVTQLQVHLDDGDQILMKPDISWWDGDRCLAVIDAKYKRTVSDAYPNADAYQMLAYCTRLGLSRGYLVYADLDGSQPSSTIVRNADVELIVQSIDLSGTIDELESSVRELVGIIAGQ